MQTFRKRFWGEHVINHLSKEEILLAQVNSIWVSNSGPDCLLGSGSIEALKEIDMSRKRYSPEQIIGLLREAGVRLSQGQTVG